MGANDPSLTVARMALHPANGQQRSAISGFFPGRRSIDRALRGARVVAISPVETEVYIDGVLVVVGGGSLNPDTPNPEEA